MFMLLLHTIPVLVSHLRTKLGFFSEMILGFTLELTVSIKKEALKKHLTAGYNICLSQVIST